MFGGAYDPKLLKGMDALIAKPKASPLYGLGAADRRGWDAIERWAA